MKVSDFKVGDKCKYSGFQPIGPDVTVVAWTPEKWIREGCVGNYEFRRNQVPVFSEKFPETCFWWASPDQLLKIE